MSGVLVHPLGAARPDRGVWKKSRAWHYLFYASSFLRNRITYPIEKQIVLSYFSNLHLVLLIWLHSLVKDTFRFNSSVQIAIKELCSYIPSRCHLLRQSRMFSAKIRIWIVNSTQNTLFCTINSVKFACLCTIDSAICYRCLLAETSKVSFNRLAYMHCVLAKKYFWDWRVMWCMNLTMRALKERL